MGRGFGFVTYKYIQDKWRFLETTVNARHLVAGREVEVKNCRPFEENEMNKASAALDKEVAKFTKIAETMKDQWNAQKAAASFPYTTDPSQNMWDYTPYKMYPTMDCNDYNSWPTFGDQVPQWYPESMPYPIPE